MRVTFKKYILHFKEPGGTSRGVLHDKETYFLMLEDEGKYAFGECNLFKGLSADDREGYEKKLTEVCTRIPSEKENILSSLSEWPSIQFGVETLLRDWKNGCRRIIFPDAFSNNSFSVPVNGLIWMGTESEMKKRIDRKLSSGYKCIKLKIGAIDFEKELALVKYIREKGGESLEIRLDANGGFSSEEALKKIEKLYPYNIHYIEQPVRAGQWAKMAQLIKESPVPIALDEELIGIFKTDDKIRLMDTLKPSILILKPALIGGFASCNFYRNLLKPRNGYCVVTSALESNIGLNAIAQYIATFHPQIPQGIGTGQLFNNNIPAPYHLSPGTLHYDPGGAWNFKSVV